MMDDDDTPRKGGRVEILSWRQMYRLMTRDSIRAMGDGSRPCNWRSGFKLWDSMSADSAAARGFHFEAKLSLQHCGGVYAFCTSIAVQQQRDSSQSVAVECPRRCSEHGGGGV